MLHDAARLAALAAAAVLDTPPEPTFDRLSALARDAVQAEVAYVMLVDDRRQYLKSCTDAGAAGTSMPISHSLCRHAVEARAPLAIPDAANDPAWRDHPAVRQLAIGAYLGVPVTGGDGHVLGTVCVTESGPRAWTAHDVLVLEGVAAAVGRELDLRVANRRLAARETELVAAARERDAVFAAMHDVVLVVDREGTYLRVLPTAPELLYRPSDDLVGRRVHDVFPAADADAFVTTIRAALDERRPVAHDYTLALPGAERPTHFHGVATPLDPAAGTALWVARDVTVEREAAAERRAAVERLREREARMRAMNLASPVGVFEADLAGRITYLNPRACEIWGMDAAELFGHGWHARVHVADLEALLTSWGEAIAAGREFARLYRVLVPGAGGGAPQVRWVHGRAAPLRDEQGRVTGSVGTVEDVTERHTAETTQRRLTSILEEMPEVVTVAAPSGRIEYLNAAGRRMLGVAGGADAVRAAGLTVAAVQPEFAPGGTMAGAVAAAMLDGVWRGEALLTRCDGREVPVEQVILAHRGAEGEIEYVSSVLRDVTERKQTESTLRAFALVDELTGLYNRRGFLALAEREWESARVAGQGAVLVYLDLDGFKGVNDTYGHAEGDRALQTMAAVLRRAFRDTDVVARLGGDEFVAFARCGTGAAGGAGGADGAVAAARATAARVQARLQVVLAEANLAAHRPYAIAASVGTAEFDPSAGTTLSGLMVEADAALYARKRARKREQLVAAA